MQLYTEDESHTKAMRPVRDTTMLSLLRRPLRNAVKLCAFRNIRESTTAEKRHCEQRFAREMKELVKAKTGSQITGNQFTCAFRLTGNSQNRFLVYRVVTVHILFMLQQLLLLGLQWLRG